MTSWEETVSDDHRISCGTRISLSTQVYVAATAACCFANYFLLFRNELIYLASDLHLVFSA
jgi:hypothetical protein